MDGESLEIYTSFFENRATKKGQSLALIVNLIALVTWKEKSHLKKIIEFMSFHLIESTVLKVTKVKFSSLIWKKKGILRGNF